MEETGALATLTLLESRLHHLEFLLSGAVGYDGIPEVAVKPARSDETVTSRLKSLEDDLTRLTSNSTLVQDMLRLQAQFPVLFGTSDSTSKSRSMDPATEASVVLAHASSFPETASRLSSLKDLTIPAAESSARLVELQPRLEKVKEVQARQLRQVAELRERSARIVERWVSGGVVGSAEAWAEVEARVRDGENGVRRVERQKREEYS
jgi:hypothetical protein